MVRAAVLLGVVVAGACGPAPRPQPVDLGLAAQRVPASLLGEWRWIHLTDSDGTRRVEDEKWQFMVVGGGQVAGRYLREVLVQSTDGRPFDCNQAPTYTQRAMFEVVVTPAADGAIVKETSYRTEPSPCDHGFRKPGEYRATIGEQNAILTWDTGLATLLRIGPPPTAFAEPDWPGDHPSALGVWRWTATWIDPRGPRHVVTEDWEVANGLDDTLAGTVVRTVETIDVDGVAFACAGGDRWTATERVAVEARRDGDTLHLREVAVEATPHPCRRTSPGRILDEATAEQIGDYIVIEWRGDRRQVLSRPPA